jgi:hypothetical protein
MPFQDGRFEGALEGRFGDSTAFRATKELFGRNVVVVVTDNPKLYRKQLKIFERDIQK